MNGGAGRSALRERLSWVPVVHDHTDVIVMSASGIGFAIFILAKACLSLQDSRVGFAFALHTIIVRNWHIGKLCSLDGRPFDEVNPLAFMARYIAEMV